MAIVLIKSTILPDFPSGSSICYYNGQLYIVGDDANNILKLDCDYKTLESIPVFNFPSKRIPKPEKADLESSTIIKFDGKEHLMVFGSASQENRMKAILIELNKAEHIENKRHLQEIDLSQFIKRVINKGIKEINMEGCVTLGNYFLFSNRANYTNPLNRFIVTSFDFWKNQNDAPIRILDITLPISGQGVVGVSELYYVESKDLLLVTLSSELTHNAYDDGEIGNSYIGWINSISKKIHQVNVRLEGMLNLSDYNEAFKGIKMEGLCVESMEGKALNLHLVADNDGGKTRLFNVRLLME